ncbi:hypothetical protein RND71_041673 [Anisodus tanguticus]|uniref:Uncharacterized protein n=1 Tax=Anisodus tanguticus TaxID=243964 RepID=A0AAE1UUJ8_9SOLA|nr:hypothetical protein RND71_041673 [Anisodus tanguticus]
MAHLHLLIPLLHQHHLPQPYNPPSASPPPPHYPPPSTSPPPPYNPPSASPPPPHYPPPSTSPPPPYNPPTSLALALVLVKLIVSLANLFAPSTSPPPPYNPPSASPPPPLTSFNISKDGCDKPGAVCQDPRFIGADGITFYFHGKDKDFCLVSDSNLHINGHFIGNEMRR